MKYAIIEASGRQFWIIPKEIIKLDLLPIRSNSKLFLRRILFGRNQEKILIGQPYLNSAQIEATVKKTYLGPKLVVYKMKPKKKYRRKQGHRQQYTRILINEIMFS